MVDKVGKHLKKHPRIVLGMLTAVTAIILLAIWYLLLFGVNDIVCCLSFFVVGYVVCRLFFVYNNLIFHWVSDTEPEKVPVKKVAQVPANAGDEVSLADCSHPHCNR